MTPDVVDRNRDPSLVPGPSEGTPKAFRCTAVSEPVIPEMVRERTWARNVDDNGVSRLGCAPVYHENWQLAPMHVGDRNVVPGAMYEVEAMLDGVAFLSSVDMFTVSVWGDLLGEFDPAS